MRVLRFAVNGDDSAYFQALAEKWATGAGFVNVEHDILVTDVAVCNLAACSQDWCAAPYPYLNRPLQFGLGCVKFAPELIGRHPAMFGDISTWHNAKHPPRHWCTLDAWIYQYLIGRGEKRCEVHELVGHIGHPGKRQSAHGCFSI